MARFFFNVYDDQTSMDEDGLELPDQETAHRRAVEGARDLAATTVRAGHINFAHRIEIEDESRRLLEVVTFADAVEQRKT